LRIATNIYIFSQNKEKGNNRVLHRKGGVERVLGGIISKKDLVLALVEASPLVINSIDIVHTGSNVIKTANGRVVLDIVGLFTDSHGLSKVLGLALGSLFQLLSKAKVRLDLLSRGKDLERGHGGSETRAIRVQQDTLVLQLLRGDLRDQRAEREPSSGSVAVTNVLGTESSRTDLGLVTFLGVVHESLLNISALQRISVGNLGKLLEIGVLGILGVTNEIVIGLSERS
jgi:hypothetical protein